MSTDASHTPSFLELFTQANSPPTLRSVRTEPVSAVSAPPTDADQRWLRHVEIEQAKGTLTALFGIDPEDAFAVMSAQSQSRNIKIHTLATIILDTLRTNGGNPEFVSSAHRSLDKLLS